MVMLMGPFFSGSYLIYKYYNMGTRLSREVNETFRALNSSFVRDIRSAMLANQISEVRESIKSMKTFKKIQRVILLDRKGGMVINEKGFITAKGSREIPPDIQSDLLKNEYRLLQTQLHIKDGTPSTYRYLVPFANEKRCQPCHGSQAQVNGFLLIDLRVPNVLKESKDLALLTFIFHLLTVAAVSLILFLLIHRIIISPVSRLQDAAQHVADGNLTVHVDVKSKDEIGSLGHHFNNMVQKLHDSQTALEKSIKDQERSRFLAEIGMMASKVAHEIRNPLNVLQGVVYYLKTTYPGKPDIMEHVQLIGRKITRLERFSKDLLLFAKPEELQKAEVDMNALIVQKSNEMLQFKQNDKNIQFVPHLAPDLQKIKADPLKMAEVLENIIQNACDASEKNSKIVISTTYTEKHIQLSIKDMGKGIPSDQLQHIFKPFFSTKTGGTGLGLCIAKKIVESHGGEIQVKSCEGKGTEVMIRL